MSAYGATVRALRQQASMSGRKLCAAVGVTPSYLSDIETGRRLPSPETSDRLADALHEDRDGLWRIAVLERLSDRDRSLLAPVSARHDHRWGWFLPDVEGPYCTCGAMRPGFPMATATIRAAIDHQEARQPSDRYPLTDESLHEPGCVWGPTSAPHQPGYICGSLRAVTYSQPSIPPHIPTTAAGRALAADLFAESAVPFLDHANVSLRIARIEQVAAEAPWRVVAFLEARLDVVEREKSEHECPEVCPEAVAAFPADPATAKRLADALYPDLHVSWDGPVVSDILAALAAPVEGERS